MILLALAIVTATPATLPAALAAAAPGDTIKLAAGDYAPVAIKRRSFAPGILIDARRATVAGVNIEGSAGIRWMGGTLRASGGMDGNAAAGYAVRLVESADVTVQGVTITLARKGMMLAGGRNIAIRGNSFTGLREDGIIATRTARLTISRNNFTDFRPWPTSCAADGAITYGGPRRACAGVWKDGNHPDAIQIYDGIDGALITGNTITGGMQGIGQMGNATSKPMQGVQVTGNTVRTAAYHSISLYDCARCRITGNDIGNLTPGRKSPVRFLAPGTTACGNTGAAGVEAMKPCN
jgi:nitrous oxidase accessory protein NosD